MRFIATGGVLRGILKSDDEITNEDMIHITDDDLERSKDNGERIGSHTWLSTADMSTIQN